MAFDVMDHPTCLSYPERTAPTSQMLHVPQSAWTLHVPIAMLLIDLVRPAQFVELGAYTGVSYYAFCQAVKELGADTQCFAVDTSQGEEHNGFYGAEVLDDLRSHHDPRYQEFSGLIQSTFDDAVAEFADGSIDLLHIDGYHTYEAVSHDFTTWLPKMSSRGVVVLHDTNEHGRDFGVWQFWDELKQEYPHFEVLHGHGLGIVAVGTDVPDALRGLLELDDAHLATIQNLFLELGTRIESKSEIEALHSHITQLEAGVAQSEARVAQLEITVRDGQTLLASTEQARDQAVSRSNHIEEELLKTRHTLEVTQARTDELECDLAASQQRANEAEITLAALQNTRTIRVASVWWRLRNRRASRRQRGVSI